MAKEFRIGIRIDEVFNKNLRIFANSDGKSVSDYIIDILDESFKNNKDNLFTIDKKVYIAEKKKEDLKAYRIIRKEYNRMNFIIRNVYVAIYKMSTSHLLNNDGIINMNIIKKMINNYLNEIKSYPNNIKKDLKVEIDGLKRLKNESYLKEKLGIYKIITMEQKRVGYEQK